jgi:PD-(D/E)XK nuclease superfamily
MSSSDRVEKVDHGKHGNHGNLLFEEETFRVRTAVFEVSRQLGTGFLEAVYQEALALEFDTQDIPYVASPRAKGARGKARAVTATSFSVFSVFSVAKSSCHGGSR